MALSGYITNGTYLIVDEVQYTKEAKILSFKIVVYNDSLKSKLLFKREFIFHFTQQYIESKGVITEVPTDPVAGDAWFLAESGLTGDLVGHEGKIITYNGSTWTIGETTKPVYYIPTKTCKLRVGGEWVDMDIPPQFVSAHWRDFFGPKAFYPESDLYKQIYLFIKSFPEFACCSDC